MLKENVIKVFSVLLCLWLLYLVYFPCSDGGGCSVWKEMQLQTYHPMHEHSDGDDETLPCSPFCYCTCCNSVVHVANFSSINNYKPSSVMKFGFSEIYIASHYMANCWQPPERG